MFTKKFVNRCDGTTNRVSVSFDTLLFKTTATGFLNYATAYGIHEKVYSKTLSVIYNY